MEQLPNELLLLVFRYLRKLDLLYSFYELNRRFQHLVVACTRSIELTAETGFSYADFRRCIRDILPSHGAFIRSLTVNGSSLMRALRPFLGFLLNLECLVLKSDAAGAHALYAHNVQLFLRAALALPSLTEVTILNSISDVMLSTLSSSAPRNLTTLTLVSSHGFPDFRDVIPMPHVRHLSIAVHSVSRLRQAFELMPNLETLRLSMIFFRNLEDIERLTVPDTLHRLHLEFGNYRRFGSQPGMNVIKQFLEPFQQRLRSITIMAINATEEFSDYAQFQTLTNGFVQLRTFAYYIRTNHQPDARFFPHVHDSGTERYCFYTLPQPQFFDRTSERAILACALTPELSLPELLDCTLLDVCRATSNPVLLNWTARFTRLTELHFNIPLDQMTTEEWSLLKRIFELAPNLTSLLLVDTGTAQAVQLLQVNLPPLLPYVRKITHLTYRKYDAHDWYPSVLTGVVKQFPNLKTLNFPFDPYVTVAKFVPVLVNWIQALKESCPQLIQWTTNVRDAVVFEGLNNERVELQRLEVRIACDDVFESHNSLSVWF